MHNKATMIRWRVLAILIFASFMSYVLRSNVSIAAPAMIEDLALSEVQWGWVLAAFTAGYAVFQIPGGVMGDRMGPRLSLALIAVMWAVLTIVTTLVPGGQAASVGLVLVSLVTVRFLVGAAHAPIFPIVNCAIERWFPVGGWAFPTGLSSTGLTLGFAATAPVLAWSISQWGWRTSFLALAPFGLLAAVLWWWYARDTPAEHEAVNEQELELIEASGYGYEKQPIPGAGSQQDKSQWLKVLRNRDVLLLMLSYSCMNFVFYDAFNWFFYYLVAVREFGATEAGFLTSTQWIAGAVGAATGGWICDRLCRRLGLRWGCRWPVIVGMTVSGILLIIGAGTHSAHLAVTMLALCFLFNQLTEGAYWATSMAVGGRYAGTAGGVMNTGANLMGIVNSLLVPLIAAWLGWGVAMGMGGVFALVGAVLMLMVRADRPYDSA